MDTLSNATILASMSSPTTVKMKSLFENNPNLVDTEEGLARRMGLSKEKIKNDIVNLVNIGILKTRYVGETPVLFLDKQRAEEIDSIAKRIVFAGKIELKIG